MGVEQVSQNFYFDPIIPVKVMIQFSEYSIVQMELIAGEKNRETRQS